MFILQMLTVLCLTAVFLASVEGRAQLLLLLNICVCAEWIACTLQLDGVAKGAVAKARKQRREKEE